MHAEISLLNFNAVLMELIRCYTETARYCIKTIGNWIPARVV